MTDGIIQKAFGNRISALQRNPSLMWKSNPDLVKLLSTIEQELIEEIKKNSLPDNVYDSNIITLSRLIGDNQE